MTVDKETIRALAKVAIAERFERREVIPDALYDAASGSAIPEELWDRLRRMGIIVRAPTTSAGWYLSEVGRRMLLMVGIEP